MRDKKLNKIRQDFLKSALILSCALCLFGCTEVLQTPAGDETLTIDLRWVKSYPQEQQSQVETGLLWTLSFLGASLPRDEPPVVSWRENVVTLRLDRAGVDSSAWPSWRKLLAAMKASEEYDLMGALDIGRFVALTLCSSRHYYALTGASLRYDDVRARYAFDPELVAIVESSVAIGNRLIEVSQNLSPMDVAFVAHEGIGSIQLGSFQITEREVLDVMPNGQLRFALYDIDGDRKLAADNAVTAAGKPSKCIWCHETELSRAFRGRTSVPGYYSLGNFEDQIAARTERLATYRAALSSRIDYSREQDHTNAELLYVSFYEPSVERVALEWGLSVERVQELLTDLPTHAQTEYSYLGDTLYRRNQIDRLAPYNVLEVPTDPREVSTFEPDLLQ